MKSIRMFGLAALAALMAMAFVGVSSAMAEGSTALCTVDQNPCSAGNIITHVHETSVGKHKLLSSPNVECTLLFLGDTKDAGGNIVGLANPLRIEGTFTYSACNNSCTVVERNGPALITALRLGAGLADVTVEFLAELTCLFGFMNCAYESAGMTGHALDALTSAQLKGEFNITDKTVSKEGTGTCPAVMKLSVTLTPLIHTYIKS